MNLLGRAAWRAYRNSWTIGFVVFELIGAALVARHSRTAHIWPFLLWMACVPVVRLLYLQALHAPRPTVSTRLARMAYGIAGWLFLAAVVLAISGVALLWALANIHGILGALATYAGLWGAILATVVLALLITLLVAALLAWTALATLAYSEAVLDPKARPLLAIRRGLSAVNRRSAIILSIAAAQALLAFAALGGQLFEQNGIALTPTVWPATLFGPVALSVFLTLTEASGPSRGGQGLVPTPGAVEHD